MFPCSVVVIALFPCHNTGEVLTGTPLYSLSASPHGSSGGLFSLHTLPEAAGSDRTSFMQAELPVKKSLNQTDMFGMASSVGFSGPPNSGGRTQELSPEAALTKGIPGSHLSKAGPFRGHFLLRGLDTMAMLLPFCDKGSHEQNVCGTFMHVIWGILRAGALLWDRGTTSSSQGSPAL